MSEGIETRRDPSQAAVNYSFAAVMFGSAIMMVGIGVGFLRSTVTFNMAGRKSKQNGKPANSEGKE